MAKALLGSPLQDIRGGLGNLVITMRKGKAIIGQKPTYRKSLSPRQREMATYFGQARVIWNNLSQEEGREWGDAAVRLGLIGYTYFMSLTTKFLQVTPDGTPPSLPPGSRYMGDDIFYSTAAAPGGIEYTATGPNIPPTCTELLIEKLASKHRKPAQRWQSVGFVSFTAEDPAITVALDPGYYATATRFVNTATGQMTDWQWGETVTVGEGLGA